MDVYIHLILKNKMGLCYAYVVQLAFFTVMFNRYLSVCIHKFTSLLNCCVVCNCVCVCVCACCVYVNISRDLLNRPTMVCV